MFPERLPVQTRNRNEALERQRKVIALLTIAGPHGCLLTDLARACYVERSTISRYLCGPLAAQVVVVGVESKRGRAHLREALAADDRVRLDPDTFDRFQIVQRALWFQRTIPARAQRTLILGRTA